jgi:hypothetical protein
VVEQMSGAEVSRPRKTIRDAQPGTGSGLPWMETQDISGQEWKVLAMYLVDGALSES